MTIATFRTVGERFLRQNAPQVLAIKGAWGVGKTYAWQKLIEEIGPVIWPKTYSYVSLFGLSSISDVRMAIVANAKTTEAVDKPYSRRLFSERLGVLGPSTAANLLRRAGGVNGSALLKNVSIGFDVIAPSLVKDMVICFDDFERVDVSRLKHLELLGLISSLKESAGCKIVLILNESKLPNAAEEYLRYREKVVDAELEYRPTAQEAAQWGIDQSLIQRNAVIRTADTLGITNVRVLKRISDAIRIMTPTIEPFCDDVQQAAVTSAVLIAWCYYDGSGQAPSPEFLRNWHTMSYALRREKTPPTEEEKCWSDSINSIRFLQYDEFDEAIAKVISQGYVEESGLEEQAQKRQRSYEVGTLEQAIRVAWDLFHDSFADNADVVVTKLIEAHKNGARLMAPPNVNTVVVLLRQLGKNAEADDLIVDYVAKMAEEDVLYVDHTRFGDIVSDTRFVEAIAVGRRPRPLGVTLRDAAETIATKSSWNQDDEAAIAAATEHDFYNLFKGPLSARLGRIVQVCLERNKGPTTDALIRIGGESELNRIRLKKFKLDVPELTDRGTPEPLGIEEVPDDIPARAGGPPSDSGG